MFKKRTGRFKKNKRTRHDRELALNVTSPRIVLFQSLKAVRGMVKTVIILAIIGSACWFGYKQIHDHFNNNLEFAIKHSTVTNFEGKPMVILPSFRNRQCGSRGNYF
jgi:hypothetical protein